MDDRSAQLYRAAAELFVERGYRDVDVVDITGRCGVSPGTFYNYFRNKRDVLELILGKGIDGLVQAAAAAGDATTTTGRGAFFAELEARMRAILQYIADNADVMAFVAFTAPGWTMRPTGRPSTATGNGVRSSPHSCRPAVAGAGFVKMSTGRSPARWWCPAW